MYIFRRVKELQEFLEDKKNIGFVPTMGALHEGHLALLQQAKPKHECIVCSIFINPTQFNNAEDFAKYPITIASDLILLEKIHCDVLFLPTQEEIYPQGIETVPFHLGNLDTLLEGEKRPGHYQGVAQVVYRLLDIVQPQSIYLGLKDFQQILVIRKLVEEKKLPVSVVACETIREKNGLAMSSRNMRLSEEAAHRALSISKVLFEIKKDWPQRDVHSWEQEAIEQINRSGGETEYVAIRDAEDLLPLKQTSKRAVVLIAAWFGGVRLIDNLVIDL